MNRDCAGLRAPGTPERGGRVAPPRPRQGRYLLHPRSPLILHCLPRGGSEGPGARSEVLGPPRIPGPGSPQAGSVGRGTSGRCSRGSTPPRARGACRGPRDGPHCPGTPSRTSQQRRSSSELTRGGPFPSLAKFLWNEASDPRTNLPSTQKLARQGLGLPPHLDHWALPPSPQTTDPVVSREVGGGWQESKVCLLMVTLPTGRPAAALTRAARFA